MPTLDRPLPHPARCAAPREGSGPRAASVVEGTRGPAQAKGHLLNFGQLVGSQLGVAVAGLVSLPVLARNLGPAAYGHFSLFMTGLGVLSNLDLARPILVRELARGDATRGALELGSPAQPSRVEARTLAVTSASLLALLALAIGVAALDAVTATALAVSVLLSGAASAAFAELSADGRVGLAGSIRNGCWAAALVATALVSFATATPHAYIWVFLAANLATLTLYQRAVRSRLDALFVRPSLQALRARRAQAIDIGAFASASAVVASADKVMLASSATADDFGHYAAQYDLATKVNVISTALGSIMLPAFSRLHGEHGQLAAAKRFVRVASWISLGFFVVIGLLIAFHGQVVALVLGGDFARTGEHLVYVLLLVGVFIHLFGFLLTAYQRACGDFRTQRVAYITSALLMLMVGALTVPTFGALGAVMTYLTGRTAELALIAVEVRRIPRAALPRSRVVALVAMIIVLAVGALSAFTAGGAR
jgi:O-antigen/teichoic acid export membrane protein